MEASGWARSTVNSVRWAGNTYSAEQHRAARRVGGDPLAHQHRRAHRDLQQLGVAGAGGIGADGLGGARRRSTGEQVVERGCCTWARLSSAPRSSGHHTVTRAKGSPSARLSRRTSSALSTPSTGPHARRRADEREVEDPALGPPALGLQLVLDGGQPPQRLAHRLAGHEPAEPLPGVDEALGPQGLQGLADGHPGGAVRSRQLGLGRQQPPRGELAPVHPPPEVVGDVAVADRAHLSHSCMLSVVGASSRPPNRTPRRRGDPMAVTATTPIELVEAVYARLAERVATGREPARHAPHPHREDPGEPPPRRRRPAASSGASATPTSTPTASPCRTPPPRWPCSSS